MDNVRPGMETETLRVLEGVSGQANSGEMLALVRSLVFFVIRVDAVVVVVAVAFVVRPTMPGLCCVVSAHRMTRGTLHTHETVTSTHRPSFGPFI